MPRRARLLAVLLAALSTVCAAYGLYSPSSASAAAQRTGAATSRSGNASGAARAGASGTFDPDVARGFYAPTRLTLSDGEYVSMVVGNPGKTLTFRVDFFSDHIMFFTALSQQSQTYNDIDGVRGSEIFYVGRYKLRFPFTLEANPENPNSALYHATDHAGVIGLGEHSPLWRYWHNFTVSPDTLILGGYDVFLQRSPSYVGPIFELGTELPVRVSAGGNDTLRTATFSLAEPDTGVPEDIADHESLQLVFGTPNAPALYRKTHMPFGPGRDESAHTTAPKHWHLAVEPQTYTLELANGFAYRSVVRTAHNAPLSVGRIVLSRYVVFVDWMYRAFYLAPSFAMFPRTTINTLSNAILLIVAAAWALVTIGGRPPDERTLLLLAVAQLYCHVVSILMFALNVWGLGIAHMIAHLTRHSATVTLAFIGAVLVGSFAVDVWIAAETLRFGRPFERYGAPRDHLRRWRELLPLHQFVFLSAMGLAIWLGRVEYHVHTIEIILLLLIVTVLAIYLVVAALEGLVRRHVGAPYMAVMATLVVVFLAVFNAYPAFAFMHHTFQGTRFSIMYTLVLVFVPSLYLFSGLGEHDSTERVKQG